MRKYNYVFYIADAPDAAAAYQESHAAADENCSARRRRRSYSQVIDA